jgi:hypothetical protein
VRAWGSPPDARDFSILGSPATPIQSWWLGEGAPPGVLSHTDLVHRASDRELELSHHWVQYAFPLARPRRGTMYDTRGPR